jgi:hypothetical protein
VQEGGVGIMMLGMAGDVWIGEAGGGEQARSVKNKEKREMSLRILSFEVDSKLRSRSVY